MSPDNLISGAVGGLVAAAIGGVIVLRAATNQDKRNLRDARSARTRRSLGALLAIALQIELASDEPLMTDEKTRAEMQKLMDRIEAEWPMVLDTRAEILSEIDGQHWMDEFTTLVITPFQDCRRARANLDFEKRAVALTALKAGVAKFQAAVAAHLAKQDKPI